MVKISIITYNVAQEKIQEFYFFLFSLPFCITLTLMLDKNKGAVLECSHMN